MISPAIPPRRRARLLSALAVAFLFAAIFAAHAKTPPDHWVSTWATSNYTLDNSKGLFGAADTTYREIVRTSLGGGDLVRIELTNEFGTEPLTIGAVHIALSDDANGPSSDIKLISANALTFNGATSIVIPPGARVISDPAALKVPAETDLAISIFVPAQAMAKVSYHGGAYTTSYSAPGNVVGKVSLTKPEIGAKTNASWYFLKSVDISVPHFLEGKNGKPMPGEIGKEETGTVVAFGDSITEGWKSTRDAHNTWPALLGQRLQSDPETKELAVVNVGIGGNRVLHDNTGPSALARFDRDVLAISGVRYVIVMEAINDIGHAYDPAKPYDVVSAEDLIQGLSQLASQAHTKGIKVIGATLTPYLGAKYASPAGEVVRAKLNNWIRTTNQFDGVIDFDKATEDPAHPGVFLPAYDCGDHLHPNDDGFKAMAGAIDLKLFEAGKK